jgi:hypothetical protein
MQESFIQWFTLKCSIKGQVTSHLSTLQVAVLREQQTSYDQFNMRGMTLPRAQCNQAALATCRKFHIEELSMAITS